MSAREDDVDAVFPAFDPGATEAMYEAFRQKVGGAFLGETLPEWKDLPPEARKSWGPVQGDTR